MLNWMIKTVFSVVEILCYAIIIFVLCMLIR
nr:MAG TPA: hypothetical protein [Caudoviricetes sp.]